MAKSTEKIATDYTDLMKGRWDMGRVCSIPDERDWVWWVWLWSPGFARGY